MSAALKVWLSLHFFGSNFDQTIVVAGTRVPQNEGQHLQQTYPAAQRLGGMQGYGFHEEAHLTELDHRFDESDVGAKLFRSWSRFWNTSHGNLLEKSPRHVMMTRFLQRAFDKQRAKFVLIMRHPLGSTHYIWRKGGQREMLRETCGRPLLEHWLKLHSTFEEDVPHLKTVVGLHFEEYLNRSRHLAQVMTDRLFDKLGLNGSVELEFEEGAAAYNDQHEVEHHTDHLSHAQQQRQLQYRRHLLEFHGNRSHVQVRYGGVYTWVEQWNRLTDNMQSPVCQKLINDTEPQLRLYGYSLRDLQWLGPAVPFKSFFISSTE
jgi:hypothetical protein